MSEYFLDILSECCFVLLNEIQISKVDNQIMHDLL